ncbi:unnamed protein product [Didymodactylos carnosus]|uniref:Uncharacterized protein n=1 Tax=Didymodactylos carnosus TaxID=1234261 RepID=A0A8S2FNL8_9BILA|nr:unnamed protein product [Didymodactylos carnosus]CAF4294438.1 unnamed protein product [Didymodactylos carnosus]
MQQLRCWNHLVKNIYRHTIKHKPTPTVTADTETGEEPQNNNNDHEQQTDQPISEENPVINVENEAELDDIIKSHETLNAIEHDHLYYKQRTIEDETRKESARRYSREMKYLLSFQSYDEFQSELWKYKLNWSREYNEYFETNIPPDIQQLGNF